MATSKNVIPVKTGIQKPLTSLDSRLRGSDKLIIIRGSHMSFLRGLFQTQNPDRVQLKNEFVPA